MDKTDLENKAERPARENKKIIAKKDAEFSVYQKDYNGVVMIKKGQDITLQLQSYLKNHEHTLKDKGVI